MLDEKLISKAQNLPVPIKMIIESRKGARISLQKKQIILRIPKQMSLKQKNEVAEKLIDWAEKTIRDKHLYTKTQTYLFDSNDTVQIMGQPYQLQQKEILGERGYIHISKSQQTIKISYPMHGFDDQTSKNEWLQKLLAKGLNQYFHSEIAERVKILNEKHFNVAFNQVKLRYTHTRWGSCSSSGNISLSTKLLLVPPIVRDYVIIHELAHRLEMNHSDRFWALVEKAMPDYRIHLNWLKIQGNNIIL